MDIFKNTHNARIQLDKELEKKIQAIYKEIADDIKAKLSTLSSKSNISSVLDSQRLRNLLKDINSEVRASQNKISSITKDSMNTISESVAKDAKEWLEKAGLSIEAAYENVPTGIVKRVVSGSIYEGNWSLDKAIWGHTQKTQADIREVVAKGIAENKSAYDIGKDLEQYVNPAVQKDWKWSKVYPGTAKTVDYNAQRLARTMVSHAYTQSVVVTTKNNPFVEGYIWHASGNHPCPVCADRDGEHYTAADLPLDHPNGRCTIEPDIPDNYSQIADRLANWANGEEDEEIDNWLAKDNIQIATPVVKSSMSVSKTKIDKMLSSNTKADLKTMEKWGKDWYNKLTPQEQEGFYKYTGHWGDRINEYLRGLQPNPEPDTIKYAQEAIEALSKASLPQDVAVRRGTTIRSLASMLDDPKWSKNEIFKALGKLDTSEQFKQDILDKIITEKAFTSTSPLASGGFSSQGIEVKILVPKGSQAMYINSVSAFKGEEELLIQAGTKFKVVDFTPVNMETGDDAIIYLEVIK